MSHPSSCRGQASVETVALLPLVVLVGALLWQGLLAGQAAWLAGSAARGAARAAAVGGDPAAAARAALPGRLERGLRVRVGEAGVRVRVRVPAVVGGGSVLAVSARASLRRQV
jgi:pilus assembly protein CpaE